MEENKFVTLPLDRYEELLQKEFLANSILYSEDISGQQIKWLKDNYNLSMKSKNK